ncbi:MAG: DUF4279 domain-containing protein [Defluviitaleaceae bacterium]|nr:DUF4279 domain-containing protein [Defluviitaleaceae bacterium]
MHYINLRISGVNLDFDEITKELGVEPKRISRKGDIVLNKYSLPPTIIQEDVWSLEYELDEDANLGDAFEGVALQLQPAAPYLKSLAQKYQVTFWVSLYLDGIQKNMHITSKTIEALSEMGATVDCTMMFLKDFYEGNY